MKSSKNRNNMTDVLQWAIDSLREPAMASADWLASDIEPSCKTAVELFTNPDVTLAQLRQAKNVFKTMRIVGEKSADRRVGARMYAAAIAAGLVRFEKKISSQSDVALKRGFQGLLDDRRMPAALRDLAGMALCALEKHKTSGSSFLLLARDEEQDDDAAEAVEPVKRSKSSNNGSRG